MPGLLIGFALVVIVLALGFAVIYSVYMFVGAWRKNSLLAERGVEVEGEVVEQFVKRYAPKGAPAYYVTYRYTAPTPNGEQEFKRTEAVWFFEFDRFLVGTKVSVRYLPDNPKVVLLTKRVVGKTT